MLRFRAKRDHAENQRTPITHCNHTLLAIIPDVRSKDNKKKSARNQKKLEFSKGGRAQKDYISRKQATKEVKVRIIPNYDTEEQCNTTNTASLENISSPTTNFPPVINVGKTLMDHIHKSPYREDLCSPCAPDTVSIPSFHEQDATFSLSSTKRSKPSEMEEKVNACSAVRGTDTTTNKRRLTTFRSVKKKIHMQEKAKPPSEIIYPASNTLINDIVTQDAKCKKMEKEITSKNETIVELKKKIKYLQSNVSRLNNRNKEMRKKHGNCIEIPVLPKLASDSRRDVAFKDSIESAAKICYPYWRNNSKSKKMLDLLECGMLFGADGYMKQHNSNTATKMARAIFTPAKVLKMVDNSDQGGCNISGAACYRTIQNLKKYQRGFLFSKSSIVRAANKLEIEAKSINNYKLINEENEGERVEYTNPGIVVTGSIDAHGLKEKALTNSVNVAFSSDGADFSRMRGHTSFGYRLLDVATKVPDTEELLFCDGSEDDGRLKLKNYHSKETCHFLSMAQVRETKHHYHEQIKHMFDFMGDCNKNGITTEDGTYHVNCSFPADLSCHWKVLGMGGACKVATMFCHLCGCQSSECAKFKVGGQRCKRCQDAGEEECFHHEMDDEDEIARKVERLLELEQKYNYLENLQVSDTNPLCQFQYDPTDANKTNIPNHIDFKPTTRQLALTFSQSIIAELRLRGLNPNGNPSDRLARLREALYEQHEYLRTRATVKRYKTSETHRLVPVHWCIPCIMHLHNRVVEKIIAMLFKMGYSRRSTPEDRDAYVQALETTMNTCVLGSQYNETHWKVPLNEGKTDILAEISLTNMQSNKVIAFINLLLADVFDDTVENWEEQLEEWTNVIETYVQLDKLMNTRSEFSDEMIENFQKLADKFFKSWVKLTGMAGVTNYIHMLGSGHLREFLIKYRNLYMYSQQGWEHMNKRACGIYHRHTQKGGHGSSLRNRSQILPIFRYGTRMWMWTTKKADICFNIKEED